MPVCSMTPVWQSNIVIHNWKVFPNWLSSTVFRFVAVGEINSKESPAPKISLWFLWSLAEFALKTSNCLPTLGTAFNLKVNVSCFCLTFHSFSTARPVLVSVRDFPCKLSRNWFGLQPIAKPPTSQQVLGSSEQLICDHSANGYTSGHPVLGPGFWIFKFWILCTFEIMLSLD